GWPVPLQIACSVGPLPGTPSAPAQPLLWPQSVVHRRRIPGDPVPRPVSRVQPGALSSAAASSRAVVAVDAPVPRPIGRDPVPSYRNKCAQSVPRARSDSFRALDEVLPPRQTRPGVACSAPRCSETARNQIPELLLQLSPVRSIAPAGDQSAG